MGLTRRDVLRGGAGFGAGVLLASCTGSPTSPAGGGTSGPPRRGGTLRVGALGRRSAITRDPHGVQANESDFLILSLLFDALTVPGPEAPVAARLASEWEPDPALRRWRFTIAPGAVFHDGSPVTSADVVWSLKRLRATPSGASRLPGVDAAGIRPDGPGAITLISSYPNADLPLQVRLSTFVLKEGTTEVAGAPGTGPFRLAWFRDGSARVVRNERWHGGDVLLDAVEVRMFDSPQAMANALLTGQIDVASNAGAVAARTAEGRPDVRIVRRPHDMAMPIVMRTADGPFADPRIREALRLAVDRPAMVRQVLSGFGSVANDVLGTGDPAYARDLPQRTRDLARAGQLLDAARFDRARTYPLYTTEDISGLAESATLFATQLRDAGVRVDVVKQESGAFYEKTWLKAPLYTTYWGTNDSVVFYGGKVLESGAEFNESGWRNAAFDRAYREAVSTHDPAVRRTALHRMQELEYRDSGYLLWGMADGIDLAAGKVRDLPRLGGYGRVQLEKTWLAA